MHRVLPLALVAAEIDAASTQEVGGCGGRKGEIRPPPACICRRRHRKRRGFWRKEPLRNDLRTCLFPHTHTYGIYSGGKEGRKKAFSSWWQAQYMHERDPLLTPSSPAPLPSLGPPSPHTPLDGVGVGKAPDKRQRRAPKKGKRKRAAGGKRDSLRLRLRPRMWRARKGEETRALPPPPILSRPLPLFRPPLPLLSQPQSQKRPARGRS